MFEDRIRNLIDRHCLKLSDDTFRLGSLLARSDNAGPIDPATLSSARDACRSVMERGAAIGIEGIDDCARALDEALRDLEGRDRIEPWHMVRVMQMQAELAMAVDELEADRSDLYARCTTPEALKVAAVPGKDFS